MSLLQVTEQFKKEKEEHLNDNKDDDGLRNKEKREQKERVKWLDVVKKVRLKKIKKRHESDPNGTLVVLMTTVHDTFKAYVTDKGMLELLPNFVKQVSQQVLILCQFCSNAS